MITVYVRGIEAHGRHGVAPEEKVLGHRFRCDLEVDIASGAEQSDRLDETADYAALAELAHGVLTHGGSDLVEFLAGEIGRAVLERFPEVQRVRVDVAKLLPPIATPSTEAGARVELTRPG